MKISSFTKTYPDGFSLCVPELALTPGSICAVVGANGSGKSTFSKVLAGILPPDSGPAPLPSSLTVGYLPQRSYPFRMSVRANLTLGGGSTEQATELLQALHLESLANRRADLLSGGELSRMALARLLMHPRDLLLLDEPTAAMDMESTVLAEKLIRRICRESGCTVLLVTHSLQQARRLADHVLFFHQGSLWEQGPVEQVLHTPITPEARAFLAFYGG